MEVIGLEESFNFDEKFNMLLKAAGGNPDVVAKASICMFRKLGQIDTANQIKEEYFGAKKEKVQNKLKFKTKEDIEDIIRFEELELELQQMRVDTIKKYLEGLK